jgi:hypothetical protein
MQGRYWIYAENVLERVNSIVRLSYKKANSISWEFVVTLGSLRLITVGTKWSRDEIMHTGRLFRPGMALHTTLNASSLGLTVVPVPWNADRIFKDGHWWSKYEARAFLESFHIVTAWLNLAWGRIILGVCSYFRNWDLKNANITFVMPLQSRWEYFHKIWYGGVSLKLIDTHQFRLEQVNINGHLTIPACSCNWMGNGHAATWGALRNDGIKVDSHLSVTCNIDVSTVCPVDRICVNDSV